MSGATLANEDAEYIEFMIYNKWMNLPRLSHIESILFPIVTRMSPYLELDDKIFILLYLHYQYIGLRINANLINPFHRKYTGTVIA